VLGKAHGIVRRYPAWWVVPASAAAWALMAVAPHPHAGHPSHHGHAPAPGPSALATGAMIVAMMLPLAIPSIRHVVTSTAGRLRATAGFLAGYLAVWIVAMLAIAGVWTFAASFAGWTAAAVGTVAAAALWEIVPARQRHARRCERTVPLAPGGWRADAGSARYGAASATACAGTCWALMAICVAFAHSLPVMAVLFGVQVSGRYRRLSPSLAALAVLAVGAVAVAVRLAAGHGA
jgi:predicted metal-binding membrane protein